MSSGPPPLLSVGGLTSLAARRWRWALAAWAAVLVGALVLAAALLPRALSPVVEVLIPVQSRRADKLLEEVRGPRQGQEAIIVSSDLYLVDDPQFRKQVELVRQAVTSAGGDKVQGVVTYYDLNLEALRSADGHATVMVVFLSERPEVAARSTIETLRKAVAHSLQPHFKAIATGEASYQHDLVQIAEKDVRRGELIGLPTAAVTLVAVFGSLAAVLLPLALAGVAITVSLGIVALVGQLFSFPTFTINMVVMMGLAVGIDYSLFALWRYREERQKGLSPTQANRVTGATAVRAVFFSGLVVVMALMALMAIPFTIFIGLSAGAAATVTVAVAACLTLLPALLRVLRDRVNALQVPMPSWVIFFLQGRWWSGIVLRWPLVSLLVALGVLVPPAVVAFQLETGTTGFRAMPDWAPSKQGFLALERDFSYGLASPLEVVVKGDLRHPATQGGIARLQELLAADPSLGSTPSTQIIATDMALISVPLRGDPVSPQGQEAVEALRNRFIPQAFSGAPAEALVTGDAARFYDYVSVSQKYSPLVYGIVLGLSVVTLLVAFRSVVLPILAVALNLLSVGAAYGVLVATFQWGWGRFLGLPQLDTVEVWLPVFLFALVFGLSMDYQVFLLSRIRERYEETKDSAESVRYGLDATGSVITGAALIMVAVFSSVAAGELVDLRQVGFGLAIAVLIDATLVRMVLLPAALHLLGPRAWYLPSALNWLPRFPIGHES